MQRLVQFQLICKFLLPFITCFELPKRLASATYITPIYVIMKQALFPWVLLFVRKNTRIDQFWNLLISFLVLPLDFTFSVSLHNEMSWKLNHIARSCNHNIALRHLRWWSDKIWYTATTQLQIAGSVVNFLDVTFLTWKARVLRKKPYVAECFSPADCAYKLSKVYITEWEAMM